MTNAYVVAADIRNAATDIANHYDAALLPPQRATIRPMPKDDRDRPKMRPAHKVWEHSPAPANVDVLEVRRRTHVKLADCARIILMECRTIDDGAIHHNLNEAPIRGLCAFVQTWALMVAEQNPVEAAGWVRDLTEYGRRLRGYAYPDRPALVIGVCPLKLTVTGEPCGGVVRFRDDQGDAKCSKCREVAVWDWWQEQMPPVTDSELVTAFDLVQFLSIEGAVVSYDMVRQWATRGFIRRHGRDAKGRTLYSRTAGLAYAKERVKEEAA